MGEHSDIVASSTWTSGFHFRHLPVLVSFFRLGALAVTKSTPSALELMIPNRQGGGPDGER